MIDLPVFFFGKLPTLPIKKTNGRFLNSDSSAAYLLHSVIACLESGTQYLVILGPS